MNNIKSVVESQLWLDYNQKAKEYKRLTIRNKNDPVCVRYRAALNKFDKTLRNEKRKYNRGKILSIENMCTGNPNKFWEEVNKLGPRRKTNNVCEALDANGNITRDPDTVKTHWFNAYRGLYTDIPVEGFDDDFHEQIKAQVTEKEVAEPEEACHLFNKKITREEVRTAVFAAKNKKAVGVDMLPYECLKNDMCITALCKLFNVCYQNGVIPDEWTKAVLVTIPKGNSSVSTKPLSYRGLSLQSCAYKIYSAVLNKRLSYHLESNNLLSNCQNGFRKDRSCVDHVYTLCDLVKTKINNKQKVYCAYVDFAKAFDYVSRPMILYRLKEYGVVGQMYNAYKAIYDTALCTLRVNGSYTDYISTLAGTKQGDNSSPTIFGIFLDNLLKELETSGLGVKLNEDEQISVLAYADDIVLLAESEQNLQKLVDILHRWCMKWRMKVNCEKTKVMVFRRNRNTRVYLSGVYYGETKIAVVSKYKYLGIMLDDVLDFKSCTELLSSSAGRGLGNIIEKSKNLKDLGFDTFDRLYKSCVCPILDYGAEVWGLKECKLIDDVQNRAARFYLGVGKRTPLVGLQGETGWLPSRSRRVLSMVRYFNKIIGMDSDRLPRRVFEHCRYRDNTWVEDLHEEMNKLYLEFHWRTMSPVNLKDLKQQLFERAQNEWRVAIADKPKLRTYCKIKNNLEPSTHVKCTVNKGARSLLTRLRLGVLPLHIEYGRYYQVDVRDRVCELCNTGEVETEEHFLLKCVFYQEERNELKERLGEENMELVKLFEHPYSLAGYVEKIWIKRKNKMYRCTDVLTE